MWRATAGVLLGYVAMFALVFTIFTGAYLLLGADGAFRPGSYDVSPLWIVIWFVVSVLAAVAGGWVCATVARGGRAPLVLATAVLLLGLLAAVPVLIASDRGSQLARTGDVSNFEAMQRAREPVWMALANPVLGAVGVLAGARLSSRAGSRPSP